jgi:transposase-like protein
MISVAARWYLRYGLSYRDVAELLAERGITADHVTIYRWVQQFTPEFIKAARPCRHAPGNRWFVDETYLKVAGKWAYLYRAVDQHGQVIDVLPPARRDLAAARRFFTRALRAGTVPVEVTTDRAHVYPQVLDELVPPALHTVEQYANNPAEADHGRLKARLRPMRGLRRHAASQDDDDPAARLLARCRAYIRFALANPGPYRYLFSQHAPTGDPTAGGPTRLPGPGRLDQPLPAGRPGPRRRRPAMAGRPGLGRAARPGAPAAQRPRLPLARPTPADDRPGRGPPHWSRNPADRHPA